MYAVEFSYPVGRNGILPRLARVRWIVREWSKIIADTNGLELVIVAVVKRRDIPRWPGHGRDGNFRACLS